MKQIIVMCFTRNTVGEYEKIKNQAKTKNNKKCARRANEKRT